MPRSYGFWLDSASGQSFEVARHQDWVLQHAKALGLHDAVKGLSPDRDEDEIRIRGCQAGLVRIRDYGQHMSVQFWGRGCDHVTSVFVKLAEFMKKTGVGPFKWMWVHNLADGCQATMTAEAFEIELDAFGQRCVARNRPEALQVFLTGKPSLVQFPGPRIAHNDGEVVAGKVSS